MIKQRNYDISQTNIAGLGSDLDKKLRLEASNHENAWKEAGKNPGIEVWRIEKFHVVPVPKDTHGAFYNGDSYILMHTYRKGGAQALSWDIHFWLGEQTTQDEAGTAAYKTVELDDHLGGAPVQHREVQDFESGEFMSYFPKGVRVMAGGIDSGFNHVKPEEYRPRLLQFKGKRHIRVSEVPLSHKSLNSGDAFILDAGLTLYQWYGSGAGALEKNKASQLGQAVEAERKGKAHNVVVEEGSETEDFWKILGGKGPIASAAAGGSDVEADKDASHTKQLYRLHHEGGKFTFTKVGEGPKINRKLLDSSDVFILDTGFEVIAWIGKKSDAAEKKNALKFAQDYLKQHGKPEVYPISSMNEGSENAFFEHQIEP